MSYTNAFKDNGVYLVVINGSVNVNGVSLGKRDALGISEIDNFDITSTEDAELLAIEIPMN
jgi:redox-sensitive bicupin YhaK (pirin superfamily)